MLEYDDIDGADDALYPRCFLVSSSTVFKKKYYLNFSNVENLGTSKSAIFLSTLHIVDGTVQPAR